MVLRESEHILCKAILLFCFINSLSALVIYRLMVLSISYVMDDKHFGISILSIEPTDLWYTIKTSLYFIHNPSSIPQARVLSNSFVMDGRYFAIRIFGFAPTPKLKPVLILSYVHYVFPRPSFSLSISVVVVLSPLP